MTCPSWMLSNKEVCTKRCECLCQTLGTGNKLVLPDFQLTFFQGFCEINCKGRSEYFNNVLDGLSIYMKLKNEEDQDGQYIFVCYFNFEYGIRPRFDTDDLIF
jgi:hypothetical protein